MNLTTLGWDGEWAQALADHEDGALVPARVTAVHRGLFAVAGDDIKALVPVAGALEAAASGPSELPTTGDWVALRDGVAIRHVLPRRTLLARADDDAREEALAANVDLCLITTSLDLDLNLRRLERFVALARGGGVEVLLVCTKGDLVAATRSPRRPRCRRRSARRRSCSPRRTAGASARCAPGSSRAARRRSSACPASARARW